ncbi:MAG: hypothetical protein ABI691_24765 [Ginsengibacter sp.]
MVKLIYRKYQAILINLYNQSYSQHPWLKHYFFDDATSDKSQVNLSSEVVIATVSRTKDIKDCPDDGLYLAGAYSTNLQIHKYDMGLKEHYVWSPQIS